jgi:hypothetical protein
MINASNLDAQKIGGALTYIRRQSIQTACGISIDLDDDGNSTSQNKNTTYSTGVFKPQGSQVANAQPTQGQPTPAQPNFNSPGQPNFQIRK